MLGFLTWLCHSRLSLVEPQGTLGGSIVLLPCPDFGIPGWLTLQTQWQSAGEIIGGLYCYLLGSGNKTIRLKK